MPGRPSTARCRRCSPGWFLLQAVSPPAALQMRLAPAAAPARHAPACCLSQAHWLSCQMPCFITALFQLHIVLHASGALVCAKLGLPGMPGDMKMAKTRHQVTSSRRVHMCWAGSMVGWIAFPEEAALLHSRPSMHSRRSRQRREWSGTRWRSTRRCARAGGSARCPRACLSSARRCCRTSAAPPPGCSTAKRAPPRCALATSADLTRLPRHRTMPHGMLTAGNAGVQWTLLPPR